MGSCRGVAAARRGCARDAAEVATAAARHRARIRGGGADGVHRVRALGRGLQLAGPIPLVVGVAAGAIAYYVGDRLVERGASKGAGGPLAVGALLDGIPEQLVLGIGLASGEGVSVALVIAIVVSNLPESIGSAADLLDGGMRRSRVLWLWAGVAVVCALATIAGFALADAVGPEFRAGASGFAVGALLVMLVDSMVPDAQSKAKESTGLATVLGFALAAGLSLAS